MSSGESPDTRASAMAAEAYALVPAEPRRALVFALRALDAARLEPDPRAEVAALHALGWAQVVLGDPAAIPTLKAGIRAGKRTGNWHGVALLRRMLATQLAWAGEGRAARREIAAAIESLT